MRTAFAAAVLVAACSANASTASAPRVVVVTQVPTALAGFDPGPRSRYPDGSRIVALDLTRPAEPPRVLSDGLVAAGGANVSCDGGRVVFVGRETSQSPFAVWICNLDGSGRVKAAEGTGDCGSAAFLPAGRIVWSQATAPGASALFVAGENGGEAQRITFSGGIDTDPEVLRDGRIVFASRAPGAAEFCVLAVHTDGTGVGAYLGAARTHALAVRGDDALDPRAVSRDRAWRAVAVAETKPRPRPQGHLSVVDPAKAWGDVVCIDARPAGTTTASRVRFVSLGEPRRVFGDVPLESDGSFYVRLPVDTALALDVLDADGRTVGSQHAPFWVRPGETRGCIGCHEDPDTAPPNVRPLAVLSSPVPLGVAPTSETPR